MRTFFVLLKLIPWLYVALYLRFHFHRDFFPSFFRLQIKIDHNIVHFVSIATTPTRCLHFSLRKWLMNIPEGYTRNLVDASQLACKNTVTVVHERFKLALPAEVGQIKYFCVNFKYFLQSVKKYVDRLCWDCNLIPLYLPVQCGWHFIYIWMWILFPHPNHSMSLVLGNDSEAKIFRNSSQL